jgi:hypothetical protein
MDSGWMEILIGFVAILTVCAGALVVVAPALREDPNAQVKSIKPTKAMMKKANAETSTKAARARNAHVWPANNNGQLNDSGYHGE